MNGNKMDLLKLSAVDGSGGNVPYRFGNVFEHDQSCIPARVIAGLDSGWTDFLRLQIEHRGRVKLLFNLLVPRDGQVAGRYESPDLEPEEARSLLEHFSDFIERDARHEIWLYWPDTSEQVVLDNHNQLYLYGNDMDWIVQCKSIGLTEGAVSLPVPHGHHYHPEFDEDSRQLLLSGEWLFIAPIGDDD